MKLSSKMPATQDATLAARMPATILSDDPPDAGEGGSDDAPEVPTSQTTNPGVECYSMNRMGEKWETADLQKGAGWQTSDRKNGDRKGLPQRDPDNDGDLN